MNLDRTIETKEGNAIKERIFIRTNNKDKTKAIKKLMDGDITKTQSRGTGNNEQQGKDSLVQNMDNNSNSRTQNEAQKSTYKPSKKKGCSQKNIANANENGSGKGATIGR